MIITLGRNEPDGEHAAVIESREDKVYLVIYEQENGMAAFNSKHEVARVLLTAEKLKYIKEFYNRLAPRTEEEKEEIEAKKYYTLEEAIAVQKAVKYNSPSPLLSDYNYFDREANTRRARRKAARKKK
jgi:hypothetical protein